MRQNGSGLGQPSQHQPLLAETYQLIASALIECGKLGRLRALGHRRAIRFLKSVVEGEH